MKLTPFLRLIPHVAVAAGAMFALAACSFLPTPKADPTRHYVLAGPPPRAEVAERAGGALIVGLRTVRVASYLDGKAMIVRRGENEIDYRDFARWAEPLSVGVARLLNARLLSAERVARVLPQPYPFDVERDVDVAVTVRRCEGRVLPDGRSVVGFVCELELTRAREGAGAGELLLRETFVGPEEVWVDGDFAALAGGLSRAVLALADRVVEALPEAE